MILRLSLLFLPFMMITAFYMGAYDVEYYLGVLFSLILLYGLSYYFSLLDTRFLTILVTFAYLMGGAIGLRNFEGMSYPGYAYWMSPESIYFSLAFGCLFTASMGLVFIELRHKEFVFRGITLSRSMGSVERSIPFILLLMVYGLYVYKVISEVGLSIGLMSRGDIYQDKDTLSQIIKASLAPLFLFSFYVKQRGITSPIYGFVLSLVLISFILVDVVILGDRRSALQLLLALLVMKQLVNPISTKKVLVRIWPFLVLIPAFILWGKFRNQPLSEYAAIWDSIEVLAIFNPLMTEFGGAAFVADHMYSSNFMDFMRPTYLETIPEMVPGIVLPNRPDGPAKWFVWHYHPDIAAAGGAFAFNALYESIMNFWYFGPLVSGAFWAGGTAFILQIKSRFSPLISGIFASSILFFFRADLISMLKMLSISFFVFFLVLLIQYCVSEKGLNFLSRSKKI